MQTQIIALAASRESKCFLDLLLLTRSIKLSYCRIRPFGKYTGSCAPGAGSSVTPGVLAGGAGGLGTVDGERTGMARLVSEQSASLAALTAPSSLSQKQTNTQMKKQQQQLSKSLLSKVTAGWCDNPTQGTLSPSPYLPGVTLAFNWGLLDTPPPAKEAAPVGTFTTPRDR